MSRHTDRPKMTEKSPTGNPLEQFLILAKSAKGAGAVALIKQALEMPGLYVFGELLDMPSIQELESGDQASYFQLLTLFAYGTYGDYKANSGTLPELSPVMLTKLRHLTLVSLATKSKCIPYSTLLEELDLKNLRELEDMIIEVIYADIVRGKLDQKNQQLEIDYAIGRDIRPDSLKEVITVLQQWCDGCETVLAGIETQINKANLGKENSSKIKIQTEQEIANIKKTLKTTQSQDRDEHMVSDSMDISSAQDKPTKKPSKSKGLRGSAKFWKSSS